MVNFTKDFKISNKFIGKWHQKDDDYKYTNFYITEDHLKIIHVDNEIEFTIKFYSGFNKSKIDKSGLLKEKTSDYIILSKTIDEIELLMIYIESISDDDSDSDSVLLALLVKDDKLHYFDVEDIVDDTVKIDKNLLSDNSIKEIKNEINNNSDKLNTLENVYKEENKDSLKEIPKEFFGNWEGKTVVPPELTGEKENAILKSNLIISKNLINFIQELNSNNSNKAKTISKYSINGKIFNTNLQYIEVETNNTDYMNMRMKAEKKNINGTNVLIFLRDLPLIKNRKKSNFIKKYILYIKDNKLNIIDNSHRLEGNDLSKIISGRFDFTKNQNLIHTVLNKKEDGDKDDNKKIIIGSLIGIIIILILLLIFLKKLIFAILLGIIILIFLIYLYIKFLK
jgi:hypothetical protein